MKKTRCGAFQTAVSIRGGLESALPCNQIPDHQSTDGQADQCAQIATKHGVEGVTHEIHGKNADGNLTSPFRAARKTEGSKAARGADRRHEHDRPVAELLKLTARIRAQSPDRFEQTAGERQSEHDGAADQRSSCEENDEENDPNRTANGVHGAESIKPAAPDGSSIGRKPDDVEFDPRRLLW